MSTTKAALKAAFEQEDEDRVSNDTREAARKLRSFIDREEAVNTTTLRLRWWAGQDGVNPVFRGLVEAAIRKLEMAADEMDNVDTSGWTKARREAFNHVRRELRR